MEEGNPGHADGKEKKRGRPPKGKTAPILIKEGKNDRHIDRAEQRYIRRALEKPGPGISPEMCRRSRYGFEREYEKTLSIGKRGEIKAGGLGLAEGKLSPGLVPA